MPVQAAAGPLSPAAAAPLAVHAMRAEVRLSPKPGLVDSLDRGAHGDMDLSLFLESIDVIAPFLALMTEAAPSGGEAPAVLARIRPLGRAAERAMFRKTGGVNTHKGQIFILGVCCSAAKRVILSSGGRDFGAEEVLCEAGAVCRGLTAELSPDGRGEGTHGCGVYRRYGAAGIRGEAEGGFPSVRRGSLPALRGALARGLSREQAALEALVHLMVRTEDSNVLHRRGPAGLALMRREAKAFLDAGGMARSGAEEELKRMNRFFIRENLSPGGCADLLALTLFLYFLEEAAHGPLGLSA